MKSGNLNFLETSGPLQTCNGTALPFNYFETRCVILRFLEFCNEAVWPAEMSAASRSVNKSLKRSFCSFCSFFFWRYSPQWASASSFTRFLDHKQRRTTVGRTPLDEWLARRRDLYLTTHNTHNRQTSMPPPPVGFEPTISAGEWPQTYALDRAATGTGNCIFSILNLNWIQ